MNKKHLRFLSLAFFVLGVFFLLNSKIDITGAVIGLPDISSGFSSILGIAFIIGGFLLFVGGRKGIREGSGLENMIKTKHFNKSVKGYEKRLIERAMSKIGTGLGNEEPLKGYENMWSIKATKGARLIFEKDGDIITLIDYLPSHEYDRLYG
jgi:Txe/YoeB family toxin of Txe-Axe toxin-antitoxin module